MGCRFGSDELAHLFQSSLGFKMGEDEQSLAAHFSLAKFIKTPSRGAVYG